MRSRGLTLTAGFIAVAAWYALAILWTVSTVVAGTWILRLRAQAVRWPPTVR
jgi:hypothetical protein